MNERIAIGHVSNKIKFKRAIWNIVYVLLFRPFPTKLFRQWRLFLLRLMGAEADKNAEVYASAKIWAPWNLKLGKNSCLGPHVICYNQAMVELRENVVVSQYAYLCTAGHDASDINNSQQGLIIAPITIHKDAWVGTRAYIGMGVEIGEKSIVGATSSVYKDVESNTIVGGNPAIVIRKR